MKAKDLAAKLLENPEAEVAVFAAGLLRWLTPVEGATLYDDVMEGQQVLYIEYDQNRSYNIDEESGAIDVNLPLIGE